MTHAMSSPSRGHELVRGASALFALLVLIIVAPALLLVLAPPFLPSAPESRESLWHALRSADDGSLLVAVVVLVAWIAWAVLTACVTVEVISVVRGVPTPRLPVLGSPQRFASRLVASVVVLLSSPTAPSVAVPVRAASVASVVLPEAHGSAVVTDPSAGTVVVDHDEHAGPRARPAHPTVVVERHDTLWRLAERHLGSGLRYTEIVRLNRGVSQPDGRSLRDPNWIYPGWILRLPSDATGARVRRPQHSEGARRTDRTRQPAGGDWLDRGPVGPDADGERTDEAPRAVPGGDGSAAQRPSVAPADRPVVLASPTYDAQGIGGAEEPLPPLVALGLGAATVAGVIAEITRQRKRFQRRRMPGEVPAALPAAAVGAELALRAVDSTSIPRRVSAGLALMADACAATGRLLPRVELIRVSADELEVVVAEDDEPVGPFRRRGERTWVWDGVAQEPAPRADRVDPCPGLVAVGSDGPYQVLVNLEAAGTLSVVGETEPAEEVRAVGAAIALDLRRRAADGALSVTWAERAAEGDMQATRREEVAELLRASGAGDVHEARGAGVAEDTWAPDVVVGPAAPRVDEPWSGAAAVVVGDTAPTGWALTGSGDRWRLQPAGIPVTPQRLTRQAEILVEELVRPEPTSRRGSSRRSDLVELVSGGESARQLGERLGAQLRDFDGPTRTGSPEAPRVLLLGPVRVVGVDDSLIPGRVQRATELAAYLATHSGVRRHQLDEAMWPGRRIERGTRNPFVSRTRQWLGRSADGHPYLPLVADGGEYRLAPEVGCDWYDLRCEAADLLDEGRELAALQDVLAMVRGRPFSGVDDKAYGWADVLVQRMVALLVDLFHLLACRQLEEGALLAAAQTAARGLAVEPVSELLHRDAIAAACLTGDQEATGRAIARLERSAEDLDLGDDLDMDTIELLHRVRATGG